MTPGYPFSAIVGHDMLRLALVLCAVRPEIGGVLIRGEKGTAKSTAVRGLARVLSAVDADSALVELPIGATEDRVVGSLDLQRVLRDGEHAFSPGLLARAHGGVLYVDEVNLLHDHLVDVLLDAAAMGRVHIERDGVSHSHDARFVLIGTMNPEEGELRPQLLDRFGLTVDVRASRDVDVRADVIRARLAFEADQAGFAAAYAEQDAELARRIAAARKSVGDVELPDNELRRIAALCAAFDVDGMRADLVVARTAVAHAAWRGSQTVDESDIRVAAELALPHRRRRDPFDDPGLDPQQLDDAMASTQEQTGEPEPEPEPDPPNGGGTSASDSDYTPPQGNSSPTTKPSAAPSGVFRTRTLVVPGVGEGAPGRRSRARNRTGTVVSSTSEPDEGHGVHVFATLLAAARRQQRPGRPRPEADDVRRAIREGREGNLVIFVVDASGSMAARDRMAAVSGATLSLLRDAYQRRDKVAVITFRGAGRHRAAAADVVGAHRGAQACAIRHRRENAFGARAAGRARRRRAGEGPRSCPTLPRGRPHRRAGHRRCRSARADADRCRAAGRRRCGGRRRRLRNILRATRFGRRAGAPSRRPRGSAVAAAGRQSHRRGSHRRIGRETRCLRVNLSPCPTTA